MKKNLIVLLFTLPLLTMAQKRENVYLSEIIAKAITTNESTIRVENANILVNDFNENYWETVTNGLFFTPHDRSNHNVGSGLYEFIVKNYKDKIKFRNSKIDLSEKIIELFNCSFQENRFNDLVIDKFILKGLIIGEGDYHGIRIENSQIDSLFIDAHTNLVWLKNVKGNSAHITNFDTKLWYNLDVDSISYRSLYIDSDKRRDNQTSNVSLRFSNSTMNCVQSKFPSIHRNVYIGAHGNTGIELLINNVKILSKSPTKTYLNISGEFSEIGIRESDVLANVLLRGAATNRLNIENSHLHGIDFSTFNFPENTKSTLRWEQFEGFKIGEMFEQSIVNGNSASLVNNVGRYDELIFSYQRLLGVYKLRGDIESYNGCFVEMKDIQTERVKYLYSQKKTFYNYFRWQIARLMKAYTEHGTDPAKAITISIYVILVFGIFYFFFPSDWDITSKSNLIKNFKLFIQKNDKGYIKPLIILIFGFLISLINAFMLSLNSFTTLGFGNIPTRGIARYVCIIQGFIGWFLLSIFTVALINQVMG